MQSDCVNGFSVLYESTGSYTPDMAAEIDKPVEIAADRYGVSLKVAATILLDIDAASRRLQAETLGAVIGTLISGSNLQAKVHALAIAFGLAVVVVVQFLVAKIFAGAKSMVESLTFFATSMVAFLVAVYICDLLIAGPDVLLLQEGERSSIVSFIEDICLMTFAYFFGTKNVSNEGSNAS